MGFKHRKLINYSSVFDTLEQFLFSSGYFSNPATILMKVLQKKKIFRCFSCTNTFSMARDKGEQVVLVFLHVELQKRS